MLKYIKKSFIYIFLCIVAGGILVTLVSYFPIDHVTKAKILDEINSEEWFPEVPSLSGNGNSFQAKTPTVLELATDRLMIQMATYEGEGQGIRQAFLCYDTIYDQEYSRYWHGYVVVLRILFYFFDYYEVRIINGIFQVFLFLGVVFYIYREKGIKYAFAISTTWFLLMPMASAFCLQYTWIYDVAFGALFIYLRHREFWDYEYRYIYLFLITGAFTTYFDLLTYPLLTWGLLIIWMILLRIDLKSVASWIKMVVISAVSWIMGYAIMWLGKWLIGSIVLHKNLFAKAFSEMIFWTIEGEEVITLKMRGQAIVVNWEYYSYHLFTLVLAVWIIYAVFRILVRGIQWSSKMPSLLLCFASSFVWYFFLAGHAVMHRIFTHKIFAVAIAAFLGMILVVSEGKQKGSGRRFIFNSLYLGLIGAAAVGWMLSLKLEYSAYNYHDHPADSSEIASFAEIIFTPDFSDIESIQLGLSVEGGTEGEFHVDLLEKGTLKSTFSVPIKDFADGNLQEFAVKWKLNPKEEYIIRITPEDNNGRIYLWLLYEDDFPIYDVGTTSIDGKNTLRQVLVSINYLCRPVGHEKLFFVGMSLYGVCFMIGITVAYMLQRKNTALKGKIFSH